MANKKSSKSLNQLLLENEELRSRLAQAEEQLSVLLKGHMNGTHAPDIKYTPNQSEKDIHDNGKTISSLYSSMSEGLAIHDLVYDDNGKAIDYIIKDVNPAFEKITGLNKKSSLGKKQPKSIQLKRSSISG